MKQSIEKLVDKPTEQVSEANSSYIKVRGAKEHNLKNIDVDIPKNELVVITGVSGSGKSSLVFDTVFAEGQRRYVESLSSYARQFLGQIDKPDVESIEGLSPAISIDQKSTSHNPRSTVATVTEVYDYLRLLYARIGVLHCHVCGEKIKPQTIDQIVDRVLSIKEGAKAHILAPLVQGKKGEYQALFRALLGEGFARVRVDKKTYLLEEGIKLEKNLKFREPNFQRQELLQKIDRICRHPLFQRFLEQPEGFAPSMGEMAELFRCRVDADQSTWDKRFDMVIGQANMVDNQNVIKFVTRCINAVKVQIKGV